MGTWLGTDTVQDYYGDAVNVEPDVLAVYLDVAKGQVLAYDAGYNWTGDGDFPGDYDDVPNNLSIAQAVQARNLINAAAVNAAGGFGNDELSYSTTPVPLDWNVKNMIRPRRGRLSFGA